VITQPRIGIVLSTTREGRLADRIGAWLRDLALKRSDAAFELVDLRDYQMPLFDEKMSPLWAPIQNPIAQKFTQKMATLDGYLFVTAEYNHSISGVLKNALDYLGTETHRKPASFVGYGSVGGARAVEHLRLILAELQVASLKQALHIGRTEMLGLLREGKALTDYPWLAEATAPLFDELVWWSNALKTARAA
jgi:NAD(P)H-dependent FMN reductase